MLLSYDDAILYVDKLKDIFHIGSGWVIIFALLIYLFIFKPETIEYWLSKFLILFEWAGLSVRKKQIEKEINANFLKSSKEITKEIEEIIPYKLKVEWVDKQDRKAFLEGNQVIVCMDNKRNKTENIAYAINDFVHTALLPEERMCLDGDIHHASCLVMTRKLLFSAYDYNVSSFFMGMLKEETDRDEELKRLINELIVMDDNGFFVQVMIREIQKRSTSIIGKIDVEDFIKETKDFVSFLYEIAKRQLGEESNLIFNGNYYKTQIVLVARYKIYKQRGVKAYTKAFDQAILEGKDSVYLMARDNKDKILNEVFNDIVIRYPDLQSKKMDYHGIRNDNVKFKGLMYHFEK